MDGPKSVESGEQNNPFRQEIRDYLIPSANRKLNEAAIAAQLIDDGNRKIFIEEWLRAIKNASNLTDLSRVTGLAYTPHQQNNLSTYLENIILKSKPELKDKMRYSGTAYNPEYDGIRKATGEKLKNLGLTNSGIKGENSSGIEYIFILLHPNSREEYTYAGDRTETRGKFPFKRKVKVSTEERGEKFRPYGNLMTELLQYNQPQSTPAVPKV